MFLSVAIFYPCLWITLVLEGVFGNLMLEEEIIPFGIAQVLQCFVWAYPIHALSADFLICRILETLEASFLNWNQISKSKRHTSKYTVKNEEIMGGILAKSSHNRYALNYKYGCFIITITKVFCSTKYIL